MEHRRRLREEAASNAAPGVTGEPKSPVAQSRFSSTRALCGPHSRVPLARALLTLATERALRAAETDKADGEEASPAEKKQQEARSDALQVEIPSRLARLVPAPGRYPPPSRGWSPLPEDPPSLRVPGLCSGYIQVDTAPLHAVGGSGLAP
eukprot:4670361-Pyramimonas_sp.AAC.2